MTKTSAPVTRLELTMEIAATHGVHKYRASVIVTNLARELEMPIGQPYSAKMAEEMRVLIAHDFSTGRNG